jgi:anti-sigma-K factor RskA
VSAPTLPTDHDKYEALAVAWVINALEPADQAIFEAHRAGCRQCEQAVATALEIAAELAYGVPDVAPPPRLRERVLAAATPQALTVEKASPQDDAGGGVASGSRASGTPAGARRPKGTGPGRAGSSERGRRRRRWAYALAAAVLVAGSAITSWEVTRPAASTDRVAALSAGSGTVATVVVHRNGADVITDALPVNTGRGTAYYVWGVPATDGGTPRVVGTFEVTATGLHSYPLRVTRPLDGYPVLAVSEERAGSTPTEPSGLLGKGELSG